MRITTTQGFKGHGPREGPKVDIPAGTSGIVRRRETRFSSGIWVVDWENGVMSKHYSPQMLRIIEGKR